MQKKQTKWNTLRKLTLTTSLAVVAALAVTTAKADVYTDPVGFITLSVNGTNGVGGAPLSFLGLGMTQLVTNRGNVTAVSGTALSVNGSPTAGALNSGSLGPLFFVEITSGPNAGFSDSIVSNDATTLFTAFDDSAYISATNTYKVYPHWTLASLFGASNSAGLKPGDSTTADQIIIQNPQTQAYATYYYATATKSLSAGWKAVGGGNSDYGQLPMFQDQGLLISRSGSAVPTNLAVKVIGAVKLGPTQIPLVTLNNFAGNVYATSAMTLSNSALYNGGNQSNSLVAGDSSTADAVLIHDDTTGAYATYYYASATKSLSAGWKSVGGGNADAGGTAIPMGANVLIQIKSPRPGFTWVAPAPY